MRPHPPAFSRLPALALCGAVLLACAAAPLHAASVELQASGPGGQPLAEAVLLLDSRDARAALKPLAGAEMEQANKRFTQRVLVVPLGTSVLFPNRDTVRHHVYSLSPTKNFELKLYSGVPANPVVFDKPGVAVLGCNIHDSMVGWVVVVETPHFAQTGPGGRVRIDNVPPGTYKLRGWHPEMPVGAPAIEQTLVVGAAGTTSASIALPVGPAR
jgi:plastocyanin